MSFHQQLARHDKGKAVAQPSGDGHHFLSFHGRPINIDFIPRPPTGPGDFPNCIYIITSNLDNPQDAQYEYHGPLSDLWTMQDKGYYALQTDQGFQRMVCDQLHLPGHDLVPLHTAVYMSAETGWQRIDRLSEQIYRFKNVYLGNKQQNWFIVWYFDFPPGTCRQRRPEDRLQDRRSFVQVVNNNNNNNNNNNSEHVPQSATPGGEPASSSSSSGAASDQTMWPSFPYESMHKPLPPLPPASRTTTTTTAITTIGGHHRGENLVKKVSRLPKLIAKSAKYAKSLSSPTTSSSFSSAAVGRLGHPRPEPVERPTVLTQLASELKAGGLDDLTGLLPTTKPPSLAEWRECCQLLPYLNADQLAASPGARSITLLNSKLTVAPFQLWTAYQILSQQQQPQGTGGGGGGFLAHGMGLGKTHCVLAAVALKALIASAKKRCDEFWALQPRTGRVEGGSGAARRHLPRNAVPNPTFNAVCPTQRPGDVQCWCVPGGVTRRLGQALVPGASVIAVSSDLMSDWTRAVLQAEFKPSSYHFVVVGGGSEVPPHLRQDLGLLRTKFKMGATATTTTTAATAEVGDTLDLAWTSRTTLDAAGAYIFLTSHHNTSLHDTFRYRPRDLGIPATGGPPNKAVVTTTTTTFQTESVYGLPVGLHFIDEAHLPGVWTPQHHPMQLALRHRHITGCHVWFVSGTPLPKDRFREMRAQIALLDHHHHHHHRQQQQQQQQQQQPPQLTPLLERLDDRYKEAKYKRSPDKIHRFVRDFGTFFSDHLTVLRFVDTTLFFEQYPLTDVQAIEPQLISRRTPTSSVLPLRATAHRMMGLGLGLGDGGGGGGGYKAVSLKEIQKLVDRLQLHLPPHLPYVDRLERRKHVADTLYLVSLFPAAAGYINRDKLALNDEFLRAQLRLLPNRQAAVTDLPVVRDYWARFARDSPKLAYLADEIDRLNRDVRGGRGGGRGGGRPGDQPPPTKCVLLTPNFSSALFLYAWLVGTQKRLAARSGGLVRPVFYHRDLAKKDKMALREDFTNITHPAGGPAGGPGGPAGGPDASRYRNILVSSVDDAGTGLNLQVASYQVLTSPCHRASTQAQAFRRTNRAGQQQQGRPLVHKVLVLEDSPVDRINLVAQARRRFRSDPFDVRAPVALWPVTSPPSESSQEDLARVAGVRPEQRTDSPPSVRRAGEGEDDIYGAD